MQAIKQEKSLSHKFKYLCHSLCKRVVVCDESLPIVLKTFYWCAYISVLLLVFIQHIIMHIHICKCRISRQNSLTLLPDLVNDFHFFSF